MAINENKRQADEMSLKNPQKLESVFFSQKNVFLILGTFCVHGRLQA